MNSFLSAAISSGSSLTGVTGESSRAYDVGVRSKYDWYLDLGSLDKELKEWFELEAGLV